MVDPRVHAAAADNAAWCDAFCRSHGVAGRFWSAAGTRADTVEQAVLWSCATRTPPFYPDAVTLDPSVGVGAVLRHVDSSAGCSVKDSFGVLDLVPAGFGVLAEGTWVWSDRRPGTPLSAVSWRRVQDVDELQRWEIAWSGDTSSTGAFAPGLLHNRAVAAMAGYGHGRLVAGGVLTCSGSVVGVSNSFVVEGDPVDHRHGLAQAAGAIWAGLPLVGYETDTDLQVALAAGWAHVGRLVIWRRRARHRLRRVRQPGGRSWRTPSIRIPVLPPRRCSSGDVSVRASSRRTRRPVDPVPAHRKAAAVLADVFEDPAEGLDDSG